MPPRPARPDRITRFHTVEPSLQPEHLGRDYKELFAKKHLQCYLCTMADDETGRVRELDPTALKALAHPLRMAIYDTLTMYGPQTATRLAERLGESTGSTSYHLRQLARHGFIHAADDLGNGREKWWRRTRGPVAVGSPSAQSDPSTTTAYKFVLNEWLRGSNRALGDFVDAMSDQSRVPEAWVEASNITQSNLRLTVDQLKEISAHFQAETQKIIDRYRDRNDPGSRPVQIQFNAFPLIDGEETPS